MSKFRGIIITDKVLNDNEMNIFLNRYNSNNLDSLIDSFNPDSKFDYFIIGDINERDYIMRKNGEKVISEKIKNIDLNSFIDDSSQDLECIVDRYHWYTIADLVKHNPGITEKELLKEIFFSIDKEKVLTIVTFHF